MAWVEVQRNDYASPAKQTSHAIAWPGATTAGNLLLLYVDFNEEAAITNATVPAGWTLAVGPVQHQSDANPQLKGAIYFKQNAASQSGNVTVTLDSAHHCRLHLEEYSGAATSGVLGSTPGQNHGSSTTLDSGSGTTDSANSLVVGLLACKNVNAETIVAGAGWSQTDETGQSSGGGAGGRSGTYRNTTRGSGAAMNIQATISASADWVGAVAEFKAAGSAPALVEISCSGAATSSTLLGGIGNRTGSNNDALAGSMAKYPNIHLACFYAKMATIEPAAPSDINTGSYNWGSQSAKTGLRGAIQNARTYNKRLILRFEWGYGVGSWMFTTGIQPLTELFLVDENGNNSAGASAKNLHSPLPWTSSGDGTPNAHLIAHYTRFLRALNIELAQSDGHGGIQADHVYHVAIAMPTANVGTEMSLGYQSSTAFTGTYDGPSANAGSNPTYHSINKAMWDTYGSETNRRVWYLDAWDAAAQLHATALTIVPSSIAYGTSFGAYGSQPTRAKAMVAAYGKRICHMTTDLQVSTATGTYAQADPGGAAVIAAVKSVGGWVGFQAATEKHYPKPLTTAIKHATDDAIATYGATFFEPADPLLGDVYAAATDGSGWGGLEDLQTRIEAQGGTGGGNGGIQVSGSIAPISIQVVTVASFPNARDSFTRSVGAGSLGTADIGEAWTLSGTAADFAVNGAAATIAVTAANQTKAAIQADALMTDVYATGQFQADTLPSGTGLSSFNLLARYVDSSNFYRGQAQLTTSGQVKLRIDAVVGGVTTILNTAVATGLTVQPANDYTLLFAAIGTDPTTLLAYLWDSSSPPPSPIPWQVMVTDTSAALQVAAAVGLSCILNTGSTATPTTFSIADCSFFPTRMTAESDMVTTVADAPIRLSGTSIPQPPTSGTGKKQTPRS